MVDFTSQEFVKFADLHLEAHCDINRCVKSTRELMKCVLWCDKSAAVPQAHLYYLHIFSSFFFVIGSAEILYSHCGSFISSPLAASLPSYHKQG